MSRARRPRQLYEFVRQTGCPLLDDPNAVIARLRAFGEMTAPVLSYGAGAIVLLVGWARHGAARRDVAAGP